MIDPEEDIALVALGRLLLARGYRFISCSPETHRRVNARGENAEARTVEDALGWSRPFQRATFDREITALLDRAGALEESETGCRSRVRFSTASQHLFVHSAYPTRESDSVFFGPDTYRFLRWIEREAPRAKRAVDIGCGSGAGGIVLADRCDQVLLGDINARALRYAEVNRVLAGKENVRIIESNVLSAIEGQIDLIVANPPYIIDDDRRLYRDGGANLGCDLSRRIALESIARLERGGALLLYTGTPVVAGRYVFLDLLEATLREACRSWEFAELDPDVFGEELDRPQYRSVDRLAVVALTATV